MQLTFRQKGNGIKFLQVELFLEASEPLKAVVVISFCQGIKSHFAIKINPWIPEGIKTTQQNAQCEKMCKKRKMWKLKWENNWKPLQKGR